MPVAKPLRAFLTERGDALKDVEATVALVSERMGQGRAHVGQVVAHGRDHFAFDKNNGQSYYVKLHSPAGEKVVWGVDLRRALEEGQIKVGDSVVLANRDVRPVTIAVKDRDASGNVVGQHEEAVKRNTWYAANIEQLRREAARGEPDRGQPLPSRDSGLNRTTTAPTTDRPLSPAATRNERSNSRDAAILQVFESALDAKHVPEEMRPGLREQARNKLDLHKALGQPVKVAIYDPAAPSREPRRTVQMPQRQHKEQERSR